MKNPDVLVFDFDGTLSDSIPSAYSAICAVFDAHELPHPLLEEVIEHLAPPFVDFYYKRGVPRLFSPEKIWEIYKPLANHGGARLFGDAVPTLSSFRRLGHRLALVTSQTRSVIAPLLESPGIAGLFDRIETDAMPKHPHLVAVRDYFENGGSTAT
ncbi:MAG: HAD hydrolase-like protein, partial [Patescibacteria group bacterium]|nr:HAD hydrolase-like protein [Patescibacteria group bacterium]